MELPITYVSESIDNNKVSWHLSIKWFHKGSSVSCLGSLPSIDSNNRSIWDSNLGLASYFTKPRTEMDLVLDVISDALLHWGEMSAFPFLKGLCSWAIMFIPISPGIIFLRCLASWLVGLFTTKIPLHGIMTPKASMSSSRYPTYSIVSPFTAVNLNHSPVGKTGFP